MEKLRLAAPDDLTAYAEYINPEEPPAAHHIWLCNHLMEIERGKQLRTIISLPPGAAKAVALEEVVPTPNGYIKIKDLEIGDFVFSSFGRPIKVINKSEIFTGRDCYKVSTQERDVSVVVDGDHLWTGRLDRGHPVFKTYSTKHLYDRQKRFESKENTTDGCRPIRLPDFHHVEYEKLEKPLLIDPYVLGVWLGDGHSENGQITSHSDDASFYISLFKDRGYELYKMKAKQRYLCTGLSTKLLEIGVRENKHIPKEYLHASIYERRELLKGLMDTDGTIEMTYRGSNKRKGLSFCNTNKTIIDAFRELLFSLGIQNSYHTGIGKLYGVNKKRYWKISFIDNNAFNLPRKRDKGKVFEHRLGRYLKFEKTESVPTQCITVDSEDGLFLIGHGHLVTHNSTYGSRMFPTWYMGRNPKHRYIQAGHSQSFVENEFGKKCRAIIDSEKFVDVFPDIRLSTESKAAGYWALNNPYGSYLTRGVGQAIAGFRAHIAGVDDPFGSREDAESETHRQKVYDWFSADFTTRLLPNRPMFVIATRWHTDDLCGRLEDMSDKGIGLKYTIINIPAIAGDNDPLGRKIGEPLWGEFYNLPHYLNLKATLPARDWNSLYQGDPVDVEGGVLKGSWFGRYSDIPSRTETKNRDMMIKRITLSADTAIKATDRHDFTVLTVWIETMGRQHYLVDVIRKRVEFADMCTLIDKTARKWRVNQILVEDRGSGTQYIQMNKTTAYAPVIAISTSNQTKEFRFDAVTPMFEGGLVLLPNRSIWLADYEKELLQFPEGKYDDQVDSTSQYLQWAKSRRKLGTKKTRLG